MRPRPFRRRFFAKRLKFENYYSEGSVGDPDQLVTERGRVMPSSTQTGSARSTIATGFGFPEAPRWHDDRLWVSDMAAHEISVLIADGTIDRRISTPFQPSGLGWMPDGTLLVVAMHDRKVMSEHNGTFEVHADLTGMLRADANDMVVAADGTAYVTNFGYDPASEEPQTTDIIRIQPNGQTDVQLGPLFRPNGIAVTPDGTTLIVAETRVHRLTAFEIGADGTLTDQRVLGALPSGTWADGICLDEAGGIWVGDPKGKTCQRVGPDGLVTDVIDTSPMACIACALGGTDRRTLFLALSAIGDFAEQAVTRPGRIDALRTDIAGAGLP
jgi:sugar lactone lactonase YvrE